MQSFQSATPHVVPPLLKLVGHQHLQVFTSALRAGNLVSCTLTPMPFLQAYIILNASRYRRPRVSTRSTLGRGHLEGPANGAGQILHTRINICLTCSFRVERNVNGEAFLELEPVVPLEVWTVREGEKG